MDDYISPILKDLAPADTINMPPASAACRSCPAAVWLLFGRELQAYCQVLRVQTWSNEQRAAPTQCDGQIAALASMPQSKRTRPEPEPQSSQWDDQPALATMSTEPAPAPTIEPLDPSNPLAFLG